MPTYTYECKKCKGVENVLLEVSQMTQTRKCPLCNGTAKKVLDGGGHYKLTGRGFHGTDYGGPTSR